MSLPIFLCFFFFFRWVSHRIGCPCPCPSRLGYNVSPALAAAHRRLLPCLRSPLRRTFFLPVRVYYTSWLSLFLLFLLLCHLLTHLKFLTCHRLSERLVDGIIGCKQRHFFLFLDYFSFGLFCVPSWRRCLLLATFLPV